MSHPPSSKRFKQAQLPFTGSSSVNQDADATPSTSNNASGTDNDASDLIFLDQTSIAESTILPSEPFHPPSNFKFKVTDNRTCHYNWFEEWKWLHYDEKKDSVFCHTCVLADQQKLMPLKEKKSKTNFIKCGFRKWKNAMEQFRGHEAYRRNQERHRRHETSAGVAQARPRSNILYHSLPWKTGFSAALA